MATQIFPIKKGSKGDNVKAIQLALGIPSTTKGFGFFGDMTASKVKAKIGKESIDNQADLDAIMGVKGTESKTKFLLFRKVAQGKELTAEERDRLNQGVDTAMNIFKGLKDVFAKGDSTSSSSSDSTQSTDTSSADTSSPQGINMTTKVLIGVGVVLVFGTIAWVIVKNK